MLDGNAQRSHVRVKTEKQKITHNIDDLRQSDSESDVECM